MQYKSFIQCNANQQKLSPNTSRKHSWTFTDLVHLPLWQNVTFYFSLLCWRFGQFCFSRRIGILVLLYSERIGWDSSLCCRLSEWVWAACSLFSRSWKHFSTPLHGPDSTWTARRTFSSSLLKKKTEWSCLISYTVYLQKFPTIKPY